VHLFKLDALLQGIKKYKQQAEDQGFVEEFLSWICFSDHNPILNLDS